LSAYHRQGTCFEDEASLVKALGENNYEVSKVEIHKEAQTLFDYVGKPRPEKAHIILRRKFVPGASNDIGFFKRADGKYEAIISAYDQAQHGQSWMTSLTKSYAVHALKKQAARMGLRLITSGTQKGTGKPMLQFQQVRG
jgi:Protein of unknown function (DUF1257)